MRSAGILLGDFDEAAEVGIVGEAFNKEVRVIGHQAVGKNCKSLRASCSSELRQRYRDYDVVTESWCPVASAGRKEIPP